MYAEKKLDLKEIQRIEYDILCVFADICEKHGLRYGLCGGTLLGAIRHTGFIPWDDDVDVEMPRSDYMKFIQIAEQEFPEYLKVSTPYNDSNTFHSYGKIYDLRTKLIEFPEGKKVPVHVYIDIFPVDGMPLEPQKHEKHRIRTRRRMLLLYGFKVAKYKTNEEMKIFAKLFWKIIAILENVIPKKWLIKYVDGLALKYDFDESAYNSVLVAGYGFRETMPHIIFDYNNKVRFVDREFCTFCKTDYYLTNIYGNYMELPPIDQRKCHDICAFQIMDN